MSLMKFLNKFQEERDKDIIEDYLSAAKWGVDCNIMLMHDECDTMRNKIKTHRERDEDGRTIMIMGQTFVSCNHH